MDTATLATRLEPFRNHRRWWLAYSGGVDSHALLHAVAALAGAGGCPPLTALHINHQLHPKAAQWADHCRVECERLGVEARVVAVDVKRDSGLGLEAAARAARYTAFAGALAEGELLLQGHHRDDQVETLLLRLLRGSGVAGLAAMPTSRPLGRGELLRPLLRDAGRADLLAYAQRHGLRWIHDDSNDNITFDRNYVRHRIAPSLGERWPAYRETVERLIAQAAEAEELQQALAQADLSAVQSGPGLSVAACKAFSPARQRNLIRHWVRLAGLPAPGREPLEQLLLQMDAPEDAEICVRWSGGEVRRFRELLYVMKPLAPVPESVDIAWNLSQPLQVAGLGELNTVADQPGGLRGDLSYHVRNRVGGERCKPVGRAHSQTLKKLLQEADVPPWVRDRLPLIYCEGDLAAVADLWVCEGFQASDGFKVAYRFL